MCDQFGSCCLFCKRGEPHPDTSTSKPRKGEFWRKHQSPGLEVGAKQVPQMERHYRKHGIAVTHRRRADGHGYYPVLTSREAFNRCLAARGFVDRG